MNRKLIYCRITAIILLAAFLAQTFSRNIIIADYYTNTGKYAANCENKAKPQMHCNGKCQMIKKLEQEEKKDQNNLGSKSENKHEIVLFSKTSFASISNIYVLIDKSKKYIHDSSYRLTNYFSDIFHPPQQI